MKWIEKSIKGPIIIYRGGIHNGQIINRTSSLEFVNIFTSDRGKAFKKCVFTSFIQPSWELKTGLLQVQFSNRSATLSPYYVITLFLLLNLYSHLQVTSWVWLFTVFTLGHPPLTYVCHMLFEIFSFDDHIAIFVDTRDTFGGARLQVHLLETIIIWERMIKWSFSPWSIVELGSGMS